MIVALDVSEPVVDVVAFQRLTSPSVGDLTYAIEVMHHEWPGAHVTIEETGIGHAFLQSVNIPESKLHGFLTTGVSKPRILGDLAYAIEQNDLRFDPEHCAELDRELRAYQVPDTFITQDCVMALAIALAGSADALNPSGGRVLGVVRV